MSEKFDFEAALKAIQSGQAITGKDGVLAPLMKQLAYRKIYLRHCSNVQPVTRMKFIMQVREKQTAPLSLPHHHHHSW